MLHMGPDASPRDLANEVLCVTVPIFTTSSRRLNAGSSRAASDGSNAGPRLHARLRAASHRLADSPPARRYAVLTSFLQHKKSTHLRNSTHVSPSESTRTVSDRTALFSNCTLLAHVVHTNMKGFPQSVVSTHRSLTKTFLRRADKRPEGNR